MTSIFSAIAHLLQCPQCGADETFNQQLVCENCNTPFFDIDGIPCLFPSGVHHRGLWQHQLGAMQMQAAEGLEQIQESASRYDMTLASRQRLTHIFHALKNSQDATINLLTQAGITPALNEELQHLQLGDLAEYYDFILRDWAWDNQSNNYHPQGENQAAVERICSLLPKDLSASSNVLVLGAGAGRLSWDLHQYLNSACTIAFDSNPLLLLVANHLIRKQQPLRFAETKIFPQIHHPVTQTWDLNIPNDVAEKSKTWFPLAGDAWQVPFKSHSFDIVVTPWFMDVNGGDMRDMIGIISQLLKPGGLWINSGPLLFTRHLPFFQKYQNTEIQQFLFYSGFEYLADRLDEVAHLASPLEIRAQIEQVWSFCAKAPALIGSYNDIPGEPPAWLIMHHLPIPAIQLTPSQEHPLIDAILALINGENSIAIISAAIADYIPEGISPKDAVVTIIGQMLHHQK